MATIDMTHRKLNFPPRFLPYLEKHRIFELFHECVELLVLVNPKDHIKFFKNILLCAALKKDKQRIVFMSPPSFDREALCELLADCLGIQNINLLFLEMLTKEKKMAEKVELEIISESQEEESCICPGEEVELPFGPLYYTSAADRAEGAEEAEGFYIFKSTIVSEATIKSEPIEVYEDEEKKPCVCVCPCVEDQEEGKGGDEGKDKDEDEDKDKDEGENGKKSEESKENYEDEIHDGGTKRDKFGRKICPKKKLLPCKKILQNDLELTSYSKSTSEEYFSMKSSLDIDYGILGECEISSRGWILQDFPMTGQEAEKLNALGIIPTHAIRIITDEEEEAKNLEYKMNVIKWMRAYKFVPVTVIEMKGRKIPELAKDLCSLLSLMPHRHAPMLPRIVLIGSRGSGVTTQGQKLALKYGLVHVEFETVIAQALQQDDDICKLYKIQLASRPDPELEAYLLEKALLSSACRNRGWVLTGYPKNIDQMRMLDIIATPPNRVIFIEVPPRECFVRLYYRKTDSCLGDEYKVPRIEPSGQDIYETPDIDPEIAARLLPQPKNNKKQIIHDIEQYFLEKKDIMAYCGKTAFYIDGNQEVDKVFGMIEQILINPAPPQPPRDPLAINHGIEESYERLKKFRLTSGMFFNNLFLNPPERVVRL